MKSRTIILSLVLFTLLSTFQYANAQDKDPSPIQVIDPQTEPLESITSFPSTSPPLQEKTGGIDRSASPSSPRSVADDSGVFYIGDKQDPATAHGGDYYAVAYIEDGALHVTTLTEDLFGVNTFYDLSSRASIPDIAYDASTGLFIVVWQYDYNDDGSDFDIHALALDPNPFVGQIGAVVWVASSSSHHESMPSVDCNSGDSSCLVAYTSVGTGSPSIEGRFMDMTTSGVSNSSDPTFPISTTIGNNPYVAMGDDGYLVAYTWDDLSAPPYPAWPVYSHVYPTYQSGGGNQYMHDTMFLINPSDLTDDYDKYSSSAAYDACADNFVVLFTYDWAGDGTDLDVGARPVHKNSGSVSDYFWIAASSDYETRGDISFIEDYHLTVSPPYASKLVVAYNRYNSFLPEGIYATDLLSNCSETNPSYRKDPTWEHFLVVEPDTSPGSNVSGPSITGAGGFQQFLVTWTDEQTEPKNYVRVFGRLMDASEKNYIPLNNK